MRSAILFLILAIAVAFVGLLDVAEQNGGLVQLAFFSLLVVFVVLMVRHIAQDR